MGHAVAVPLAGFFVERKPKPSFGGSTHPNHEASGIRYLFTVIVYTPSRHACLPAYQAKATVALVLFFCTPSCFKPLWDGVDIQITGDVMGFMSMYIKQHCTHCLCKYIESIFTFMKSIQSVKLQLDMLVHSTVIWWMSC